VKGRAIWRTLSALAVPILWLGGCRGIVGIHDLDVVADGSEGGTDAGGDVVVGVDALADSPVGPAIDAGCQLSMGMACGMCCRMALIPAFAKLEQIAKQTGCVCGSGACTSANECGADLCMAKPSTMGCGACVDMSTRTVPGTTPTPQCSNAMTECMADSVCRDAPICQHSCNP
jgi:hypothetical protein